jgi:hypothetical protein
LVGVQNHGGPLGIVCYPKHLDFPSSSSTSESQSDDSMCDATTSWDAFEGLW